ncbi:MAG: glutamine synthetase family protein [Acidimicrobiia bacterium]
MTDAFERIRVLWPDHLGLARGKYIPARLASRGVRHCTGVWALGYDRNMTPGTPGSNLEGGLPDMDATFDVGDIRPGWEPGVGVVVADLQRHGDTVAVSPRAALRKAIADWQALGLTPMVGIELEAYLLEPDGHGGWRPLDAPGSFVYGTGPSVDPHGVIEDIWRAADAAGIPLESVNSEYDTPQFEFTIEYRDALRSADDAFLFKVLAREIAQSKGLLCTFMGKPLSDRGGSGTHFNVSFNGPDGGNAIHDASAEDGLSALARRCIAGLLAHHRALAGLCAPTVNAYKRLQPASLSGYWANWGYDHRAATVRIPPERGAATRLEHRLADGAAPAHVAMAAILQAARLGSVHELVAPPPETGDGMEEVNTDVCCPASLGDALDALVADEALVEAVGAELVSQHVTVKRTEWQRFVTATTDWERNEYLPFL